ncbi:uncharacterized protein EDB91DRAFT_1083641 [Suillus paluster]|uniref:uncharacterized protein n=1 Tax=Suillus paluster TaxID=48578 RepID=UPI001B86FD53|nr:uncharacterized protein EDB91DRAFT_1083641 [Suillus paluster]KAG1735741.1 hypothetical protein EDB91DRAFT_1083641 [Suillus paluster]
MARPCLHNTKEEKAEAARAYKRAYYACHRDKLCAQKKEIYKGEEDTSKPATVGRPHSYYTTEEKIEAAHRSRKAYYARNREEIHIKCRNKSNLDNTSNLKPARLVRHANRRKNKWLYNDIDTSLQVLIGSSSTALVEGLCELFIANPDKPDSLDVLRLAHNGLEDLLLRAQTLENDVLEECGTGQDLSQAHSSVSNVHRVLADLGDVFTHAMLATISAEKSEWKIVLLLPINLGIKCDETIFTKMAPRTWLTQEQLAFNTTFEDKYLECQKKGNYTTFWQPFFEQWEERWPARASLFPGIPMDQALTAAQLEEDDKFRAALQKRLIVKFRNDYGNSKPGHKAAAAGNLAVHKLLSNIIKGPTTGRKRPLKETEVYAKKYYATRVQASVKDELDAIKEQPNAPDPKKTNIRVVQKHIDRCWENESVEVKEEISQLTREMREEVREAAKGRKLSEVTDDLIIPRLTEILSTFFGELHEATGWTFSVLLGGPDPSNEAEAGTSNKTVAQSLEGEDLRISAAPDGIPTNDDSPTPTTVAPDTLHGSHPASLQPDLVSNFPSTCLAQEEVVPVPPEEDYLDFFRHLPPTPQDNEIDQQMNMLLSMMEGYVPFCPPPLAPLTLDPMSASTTFLNLDSNLESFDEALKSMQSQKNNTGMVCSPPCIRYKFDSLVQSSLPTVTASTTPTLTPSPPFTTPTITPCTTPVVTPYTTPTITHSPATPFTTPAITPCTTPDITPRITPVVIPRTTPTITHSPAVRSSTTPATTPTPVAPTTTIPATTPLLAAPTTIIPATTPSSLAAPTTLVTLGMTPPELMFGMGADAQNPSNVVDEHPAKRQKWAPCARAGETDPPQAVSSG